MTIEVNLQTVITLASGIAAVVALVKYITMAHDQVQKWNGYDQEIKEVKESIKDLKKENETQMKEFKNEQCMQTYVLQAVLDGLHQLNCNGEVTKASEKLSKYINQKAHGQKDE